MSNTDTSAKSTPTSVRVSSRKRSVTPFFQPPDVHANDRYYNAGHTDVDGRNLMKAEKAQKRMREYIESTPQERTIAALEENLDVSRGQIASLLADVTDRNAKIESLEGEINTLKDDYLACRREVERLKAEAEAQQGTISRLSERARHAEESADSKIQAAIAKERREAAKRQPLPLPRAPAQVFDPIDSDEIKNLRAECESKRGEIRTLRGECERLRSDLQAERHNVATMRENVARAEEGIDDFRRHNETLKNQAEASKVNRQHYIEALNAKSSLEDTVERLMKESENLKKENARLEEENTSLRLTNTRVQGGSNNLQARVSNLETELRTERARCESLRAQANASAEDAARFRRSAASAVNDIAAAENSERDARRALQRAHDNASASPEVQALRERLANAHRDLTAANRRLIGLQVRYEGRANPRLVETVRRAEAVQNAAVRNRGTPDDPRPPLKRTRWD
jgi:chromosome segregation ATPase